MTKVVGVHATDNQPQPKYVYSYCISQLISLPNMQFNPNSRTNGLTLLEHSLTDRSDREEFVETKVVGVHMMDNQSQPRK